MKKKPTILILTLLILLIGCSVKIAVSARLCNIDSENPELILHFDFKKMYSDEVAYIASVEIFRNDSLICKLENQNEVTEWDYPPITDDFKIIYSEKGDKLPQLIKSQEIRFEFTGGLNTSGYGTWMYKPKYSDTNYRCLFDKAGNQRVNIDYFIEPSNSKKFVRIKSTERFSVIDSTFKLTYLDGEPIKFRLKYKNNPTNEITIIIDQVVKEGKKLKVYFSMDEEQKFEDVILMK